LIAATQKERPGHQHSAKQEPDSSRLASLQRFHLITSEKTGFAMKAPINRNTLCIGR
jgi:hypothetical protein